MSVTSSTGTAAPVGRESTSGRRRHDAARSTFFQAVTDALAVGLLVLDRQGHVIHSNPQAHSILGLDRPGPADGRSDLEILSAAALDLMSRKDQITGQPIIEVALPRVGRRPAVVRAAVSEVREPRLGLDGMVLSIRPVIGDGIVEAVNARVTQLVEMTSDFVLLVTTDLRVIHTNNATRVRFGNDVDGRPFLDLLHPDSQQVIGSHVLGGLRRGDGWSGLLQLIDRSGDTVDVSAVIHPHRDSLGSINYIAVTLRDVTEERRAMEALTRRARTDPVTGLPNRLALEELLADLAANPGSPDELVVLAVLDLSTLPAVNDTMGHAAGDELVAAAADRLRTLESPVRWLAHADPDDLVVVTAGVHTRREVPAIVEMVKARLAAPVVIANQPVPLATTVGIGIQRRDGLEPERLLREADAARSEARRNQQGAAVFGPDLHAKIARRLQQEADLREAIDHNQITAWLQPVIDITTGRMVGCEALARWVGRPDAPGPSEFIPLAEEIGLIDRLAVRVLDSALAQAATLRSASHELADLQIAINISGRQLWGPGREASLLRHIAASGTDPSLVAVELTETVLLEQLDHLGTSLHRLRDAGLSIALDDFGCGYSSLNGLRTFPVNSVKLDTTYTQSFLVDRQTRIITEAVVQMAERLDLEMTAEGVETAEQLEMIRALGIRKVQGYYFAPALPLDQLLPLALERSRRPRGWLEVPPA